MKGIQSRKETFLFHKEILSHRESSLHRETSDSVIGIGYDHHRFKRAMQAHPAGKGLHTEEVSPWKSKNFCWFFIATTISIFGGAMSPLAISFTILAKTGSAEIMSIVLTAQSVCALSFLLIAGTIADRFARSTVLVVSNTLAAIAQAVCAAELFQDSPNIPILIICSGLSGIALALEAPAISGILPRLVEHAALQKANSARNSMVNLAKITGSSLAGVIVAGVGGAYAIALDSVSFIFAAIIMWYIRWHIDISEFHIEKHSVISDLRDGWKEFIRTPWLVISTISFTIINFAIASFWNVLGRMQAEETHQIIQWGITLSVRAFGMLVMSFILYQLSVKYLLAWGHAMGIFLMLPMLCLSFGWSYDYLMIFSFFSGLGSSALGLTWQTSLQEHVPEDKLARISSYDIFGAYIAVPIGQMTAMPIFYALGFSHTYMFYAVCVAIVIIFPLLIPSYRRIQHQSK